MRSSYGGEGLMGCIWVKDYNMALFKVLNKCMEVSEVEPTTCVITALR